MPSRVSRRRGDRASPNGIARHSIGEIRRREIVDAAVCVITEEGIARLSLSAIESRTGMSRGQLTYYFRTKEAILLAVFDRVIELMYVRLGRPESRNEGGGEASGWALTQHLLETLLGQPMISPEFHVLQYTFLAQIGSRPDFRRRLSRLYGEWRSHMIREFQRESNHSPRLKKSRTMASLIQAILHGLSMQLMADPNAFDCGEMLTLCRELLGTYLLPKSDGRQAGGRRRTLHSKKRKVKHGTYRT